MAHRRQPPRREKPLEEVLAERHLAEAQEDTYGCLGGIVALFSMLTLWAVDLFLLTLYWNWFAVPLGAPTATVWHTAGILLLRLTYMASLKGLPDLWERFTNPPAERQNISQKEKMKQGFIALISASALRLICV